jgi:hypothetical protein
VGELPVRGPVARGRAAAVVFAMLCTLASAPTEAFLIGNHSTITRSAIAFLKAQGVRFSRWEEDQLEDGASDTDLSEGGLIPRHPYEPRFHFDNLTDYEAIRQNYRTVVLLVRENILKPKRDPWEFGKVLHAIQDFYSHSNYVELFRNYRTSRGELVGSVPPLEEVLLNPNQYPGFVVELTKLRTGFYPDRYDPADNNVDHGPPWSLRGLHKDAIHRAHHLDAKKPAERATAWYLLLYLRDSATWAQCGVLWGIRL